MHRIRHTLARCFIALSLWWGADAALRAQSFTFSTLAGGAGYGSADGVGTSARFDSPEGIALDGAGNLYVADSQNNTVRRITPAGVVSTLAGTATNVPGSLDGVGGDAAFNLPAAVAVDSHTNVYVADLFNNEIRKCTQTAAGWTVTTLAGHANAAFAGLITNYAGFITNSIGGSNRVAPVFWTSPVFTNYSGLVTNVNGTTTKILAVVTNTPVYTNISVISNTKTTNLVFLATNLFPLPPVASGRVFFAKSNYLNYSAFVTNVVGTITNVAIVVTNVPAITVTNIINGKTNAVSVALGTNQFHLLAAPQLLDGPGADSLFYQPAGLAVDGADNLYVADGGTNGVRRITPAGAVSTLPGSTGAYTVDASRFGTNRLYFHSSSVAVDGAGNVFVSDKENNTVRRITPAGLATTIAGLPGYYGVTDGTNAAARFGFPTGLALDAYTNLYVTDTFSDTIRKLTPAGTNWVVTTVAGASGVPGSADGSDLDARFNNPGGIAVDGTGNLFVADTGNNAIRLGQTSAAAPVAMQIARSGRQLVVSWPSTAAGYVLQVSTNLGGGWTDATNAPALWGDSLAVTNVPASGAVFYRLRKP